MNVETNRHYSDKGGHFEKSAYWKLQRKLEREGVPFMKFVPDFKPQPHFLQAGDIFVRNTKKEGGEVFENKA